jgi:hypothetical protein
MRLLQEREKKLIKRMSRRDGESKFWWVRRVKGPGAALRRQPDRRQLPCADDMSRLMMADHLSLYHVAIFLCRLTFFLACTR